MITYDFEDGLFPEGWTNSQGLPWVASTETVETGTYSLASNPGIDANQVSACFIIGDFEAGTFDLRYLVSSEPGYDYGHVVVDGVAVVDKVAGTGTWTDMPQQTLTAGIHIIQFVFNNDNGSVNGTNSFCIDSVTLPNFKNVAGAADTFKLSTTVFANDATNPYVPANVSGARNAPLEGVVLPNGGSAPSIMTYTSPADSPAGVMFFVGYSDHEDKALEMYIDNVQVFTDVGYYHNVGTSLLRAPVGHYQTVTAGAHTYEIRAAADSQSAAYIFYEPSFVTRSFIGSVEVSRGVPFDIIMGSGYVAGATTNHVEVWVVGDDGINVKCKVTLNTDEKVTAVAPTMVGNLEVRTVTAFSSTPSTPSPTYGETATTPIVIT